MSGSIFKTYTTDDDAVEHGAWNDDYEADIRVRIRSTKSSIVTKAQEKVDERNMKYQRRGKSIPRDVQRKNQIDLMVAMVSDWSKQTKPSELPEDEHGQPLACTSGNVKLVADLDEFREQTIGFAMLYDNYRKADLEEKAKNSETSGAPSSAPAAVSETPAV